jgi:hypothetical protein
MLRPLFPWNIQSAAKIDERLACRHVAALGRPLLHESVGTKPSGFPRFQSRRKRFWKISRHRTRARFRSNAPHNAARASGVDGWLSSLRGQIPGGRLLFTAWVGSISGFGPRVLLADLAFGRAPPAWLLGPASLKSAKGRGSGASKRGPAWVRRGRFCRPRGSEGLGRSRQPPSSRGGRARSSTRNQPSRSGVAAAADLLPLIKPIGGTRQRRPRRNASPGPASWRRSRTPH